MKPLESTGTLVDQLFTERDVNASVQVVAAAWYILTHMADNYDAPPARVCGLRTVRPAVYAW